MNIINWLEEWYKLNCATEISHHYAIKIESLDNPGWMVKIDLTNTSSKDKKFDSIDIDNGEEDWIMCRIKNNIFEGAGDPSKLLKILNIFKEFVEVNK